MPVVGTAKEQWPGRTGKDDWNKHRTYTRVFEVWTDDPNDDVTVAGNATGIPLLGDSHPSDAAAVVVSVVPTQDSETPYRWDVSIEYDTQPPVRDSLQPTTTSPPPPPPPGAPGPQTPADRAENPLDRAPIWKVSFQQTTEVVTRTFANGEDILNSAGLPFDPPITIEVSRPLISVTWNVATLNLDKIDLLQDGVNNAEFFGRAARTLRCVGIEAGSGFENGVHFWTVTVTLAYNRDTWDIRVLDAGYAVKKTEDFEGNGSTTERWVKVKDPYGNEATEPVPLDGAGQVLATDEDPVYLTFPVYEERDFAALLPS